MSSTSNSQTKGAAGVGMSSGEPKGVGEGAMDSPAYSVGGTSDWRGSHDVAWLFAGDAGDGAGLAGGVGGASEAEDVELGGVGSVDAVLSGCRHARYASVSDGSRATHAASSCCLRGFHLRSWT